MSREDRRRSSVRSVLICGNGPALTVGGDIDYFHRSPQARTEISSHA